jgi:hypothetical protein
LCLVFVFIRTRSRHSETRSVSAHQHR